MKSRVLILSFLIQVSVVCGQSNIIFNQKEFVWDLSEIFKTDKDWDNSYDEIKELINKTSFEEYEVFESADKLEEALKDLSTLRTKTLKVAFYAILRWEEGKVDNGEEFLEKGEELLADFEALLAELEGKILQVEKEVLISWVKGENLNQYRHWLNQIIDQQNHRSTPEVEFALRKTRDWISSSIDTYWNIQGINGIWPGIIDENGKEIVLNRSAYRKIRVSNDVQFRDKTAKKYFESLEKIENTLGDLYVRKIKSELDLAELRGFEDGIDANWFFYGGCPKGTYKTLLEAAQLNKEVLQRYARLRGEILNGGKLSYLDFYRTPKVLYDFDYNFNTAMNIALSASKEVSPEFHSNMKRAFENKNWMHLADIPKTARYHIRPPVTGIHPFLILKYKPNIVESRALVGGLFSLASSVSSIGKDGVDIFETEAPVHISGTIYAGDIYFDRYVAAQSKSKKERIGHLLQALEFLRRFYKNAIFIELDSKVQDLIKNGHSVNGKEISRIYLELIREYYGSDNEVIEIPEYLKNDWMTETAVLFMPKYEHHYWAPSLAVGAAMTKDRKFANLFLSPLEKDRYDSYSLFKSEGIDLKNISSYSHLFNLMNNIMDEIEKEMSN